MNGHSSFLFETMLECKVCGDIYAEYRTRLGLEDPLCRRCQKWADEEIHGIDPKTRACKSCGEVEA